MLGLTVEMIKGGKGEFFWEAGRGSSTDRLLLTFEGQFESVNFKPCYRTFVIIALIYCQLLAK